MIKQRNSNNWEKIRDLESSGLLGLPNGLDKRSSGECLHAPIPQTSSGATIPK